MSATIQVATRLISLADIEAARARIAPYVRRTPVLRSDVLDEAAGARLAFKCENLQEIGAFKARGAANAVFSLGDEAAARGVATHSSGNHASAVARAAKLRGIPAYIVMPQGVARGATLLTASQVACGLLAGSDRA